MKRSVLIFFICITSFLQAQDLPEPMRPKRIVNDFTQLFSPQQQQALEQKLRNFNDTPVSARLLGSIGEQLIDLHATRLRPQRLCPAFS